MRSIRLNDGCVLIIDDLKEVKIIREIGGKVKREIRRIKTEPVEDEEEEEEEDREFQPPRPIVFQRQENASVNREIVIKQEVPDPDPEPETRQDEQPPTDTSIQTQAMQTQAIQTQAIPLDKEELIICCQASKRQILTFQRVYQEASAENQREELWEICNGIADPTSGKLEVLKGITTVSLERNETILIVADNEQVLNDLYDYGERNFNGSCEILITAWDVQETAKTGGFKAVFACTSLLPTLKDSGMTVHRSIVYENFSTEKTLPGINEITTGPVYHLIICGSIEERVLQVRYNLCPDGCNEEEFLNSQGDFLASETHKLLDCDCLKEDEVPVKRVRVDIINQEELKNWQHIPGGDDHKEEHFQVGFRFCYFVFRDKLNELIC